MCEIHNKEISAIVCSGLKNNEIRDLLQGLDKTKAERPSESSNWVLRQCAEKHTHLCMHTYTHIYTYASTHI